MKKKRFYNNKKRNEKWTESPKGRKIRFADKYIEAGNGSDKYDNRRTKEKKPLFTKEHFNAFIKYAIITVSCFAIISIGYSIMDLYIERKAMPPVQNDNSIAGINTVQLQLKSQKIESMAMDAGVMLGAVIENLNENGYTSVTFDLKRDDGTIGYNSNLATVDMYNAESSPAGNLKKSALELVTDDILPIGRISCYKDSIFATGDISSCIIADGKPYQDAQGNLYINPDSQAVYNYIKGIIEEAKGMGITIFVLDNCTLPKELSGKYSDGFKALSDKLYKDLGDEIKLLEGISVSIHSEKSEEIEKDLKKALNNHGNKNIIFSIKAKNKNKVKNLLDNQNGVNYIITE